MPEQPNHRILRLAEVRQRTGLGRSTIYRLVEAGDFPQQIRLSRHSVGWLQDEIERWIEQRVRERNAAGQAA